MPVLEQRITELTNSLQKSSRSISDIEQEIEQRKSLVDKLREDAKIAEGLKTLNKEQVDAVAATLRGQLQVADDQAWWGDVRMNVFFTLLGTLLGQLTWLVPCGSSALGQNASCRTSSNLNSCQFCCQY